MLKIKIRQEWPDQEEVPTRARKNDRAKEILRTWVEQTKISTGSYPGMTQEVWASDHRSRHAAIELAKVFTPFQVRKLLVLAYADGVLGEDYFIAQARERGIVTLQDLRLAMPALRERVKEYASRVRKPTREEMLRHLPPEDARRLRRGEWSENEANAAAERLQEEAYWRLLEEKDGGHS